MDEKWDKSVSRRDFLKGATVAGVSLLGPGIPFITKRAIAKEGVVKYGTMHPLTGAYSALGADQMHATQLAVEECRLHQAPSVGALGRVEKARADAEGGERVDLVLHEGDER